MVEISRERLNDVISRALNEVGAEARASEASFSVADLRAHVAELGARPGADAAWTISYSTSKLDSVGSLGRGGGEAAWTISYSTTKLEGIEGIDKVSGR